MRPLARSFFVGARLASSSSALAGLLARCTSRNGDL
jgi:hypothetical protein